MKLGAAYNLFDGVEILEKSILSIRDHVDFICVVYQDVSNYGNILNEQDLKKVVDIFDKRIIEHIQFYEPVREVRASVNELVKRNIGKEVCRLNGCTHFLTIDADEVYIPSQFEKAKKELSEGDYDSSACQMLTYYKEKDVILWPPESYYVPFIYKLDQRSFGEKTGFPVEADPTRKLKPGKIRIFERNELQMHHYSYVREDLRQKLENSSALLNWPHRVNKIVDYYKNWEYPDRALLAGSQDRYYNVIKVSKEA